jgi:hypothetical protein
MTKYLRCFKNDEGRDITVGKRYKVVATYARDYVIVDDVGDKSWWPIEIDHEGESYRDWFTLEFDELKIEEADSIENIMVLKDESLGVIEHEYIEVNRKARVGERIKVTASLSDGEAIIGSIGVCTRTRQFHDGSIDTTLTHDEDGFIDVERATYVVLEPSNIIRINNERFHMVDRKAAVGERVIVTAIREKYRETETLAVGQIGVCTELCDFLAEGAIDTTLTHDDTGFLNTERVEYRVLEPLSTAKVSAPLSERPAQEQSVANIVALTLKVAELEKRVATLESTTTLMSFDEQMRSISKVMEAKSPQQIRDEIVERAKADVMWLVDKVKTGAYGKIGIPAHTEHGPLVIDFVVNRDKRKVTAICRYKHITDEVAVVGRAKATPGEVFNVHIGKVIALFRALELDVPAEYVSVPSPTEVRVGDIVNEEYRYKRKHRVVEAVKPSDYFEADRGLTFVGGGWAYIDEVRIVDDSREEVSA